MNFKITKETPMKKFQLFKIAAVAALALAGFACSDSSSSGSSTKTAKFVDSVVVGLGYKTSSGLKGVTNEEGEFEYKAGDTVIFFIGDIEFPGVIPSGNYVTPAHIANTQDWEDSYMAVNIVRFLLSIDEDGNPDNGIQIPEAYTELAADMYVQFTADFDNFQYYLIDFFAAIEEEFEKELELVSVNAARAHLKATIKELGITITVDSSVCEFTSSYGWSATFDKIGSGPFEDEQEAIIDINSNRVLYIDQEKISNFCVYSETKVGNGKDEIVTKTYTWVDGKDVYVFTDINEEFSLQVIVNQVVNGSFINFSYLD